MSFKVLPWPIMPEGILQLEMPFDIPDVPAPKSGFGRVVWNFRAVNPIPSGWTPFSNWITATTAWYEGACTDVWPGDCFGTNFYVILRGDGVNFRTRLPINNRGALNADTLQFCLSSCFTKRSTLFTRNGIGRAHWLPVPKNFLDFNGAYTQLAYDSYHSCAKSMVNPIVLNDVTFQPCLWSKQLNTFPLLTNVDVVTQPCVLYRRRQTRGIYSPLYLYV